MKKYIKYIIVFLLFITFSIGIINYYVISFSEDGYFNDVEKLNDSYVGLVLGASVIGNTPSDILQDRLNLVYKAYEIGKIEKIIVSGDNSKSNYNEPFVMQKYLIGLGVNPFDIYLDYAGFDTFDSIYRAKEIFGVEHLVIFTQDFHLKRAMYIAKRIGINTLGVETNVREYKQEKYNNRREILARIKAFLDVEILRSKPKYLGEKIKIISDEKVNEVKRGLLGE